jgi:hypothetical protein
MVVDDRAERHPLNLPALPYEAWSESLLYLHLVTQMVGKVRLALHPPINHWWHVTLYLSARGITTGAIPFRDNDLDIEIDLLAHRVVLRASEGRSETIALGGPISDVYRELTGALDELGVVVAINPNPYECRSTIPYPDDHVHTTYDRESVSRAFEAFRFAESVFKRFRSGYLGKCSPVHLFWHGFDLAVTRFSGRPAPSLDGADHVTKEGYSHELNSAGFWFGDDTFREAAFYCYTAPLPEGLTAQPLMPFAAKWLQLRASPMAILRYEDVRSAPEPARALSEFLESAYAAGANAGKWDRSSLERVGALQLAE